METLKVASSPWRYTLLDTSDRLHTRVGGLRVRELFQPRISPSGRANVGDYSIEISTCAATRDEALDKLVEIRRFAARLDEGWVYVTSLPLIPAKRPWMLVGDQPGWTSNWREVDSRLAVGRAEFSAEVTFESVTWMQLPRPPLLAALRVLEGLAKLRDPIVGLHRLYFASLKSEDSQVRIFLRAKCLDIVRALLPGKTDDKKQDALHQTVQGALSRSLHDLYGLSNTRFNSRHPIDKTGQLYPEMTCGETNSFLADATLVVRGFMCAQLEIEPFVVVDLSAGNPGPSRCLPTPGAQCR